VRYQFTVYVIGIFSDSTLIKNRATGIADAVRSNHWIRLLFLNLKSKSIRKESEIKQKIKIPKFA
jgi:hypothetical protein